MNTTGLYPLRFEPIYRRYVWGGRRLAAALGKSLGVGSDFAESWEVVDHGGDQSVVLAGPLQGVSLGDVCAKHNREMFGRHAPQQQFPLLFKFLDAHRNLSIQVHPNDAQAAQLVPPDLGKTEAWVVLHAEPGSRVFAGLKQGLSASEFEREVRRGAAERCLHQFEPQPGDCIFVPAGTVHALGAGLLVAEIQQASDTTYRISDWNRVGSDGQPRALHVDQALQVIDFSRGPVDPQTPCSTDVDYIERLVQCDRFVLNRWNIQQPVAIGGDDRFHILALLEGTVRVAGDAHEAPLVRGQTILLPASCESVLAPLETALLLEVHLPD